MADETRIDAVVAGFTVPVIQTTASEPQAGRSGIGWSLIMGEEGGLRFALTIVHPNGTILSASLDEAAIHRLAEPMADFIDALPAVQSEARH